MIPEKSKFSILVVDDEKGIRDLMLHHLSRRHDVESSPDAATALVRCGERLFDMVISDINMPGMDGLAFLAELSRQHPRIIRVLMTGYNINDYLEQARTTDVSNIISKTAPVNFAEIDAIIDSLLTGEIFGLNRYLLDDASILCTRTVRSSFEARSVREEIITILTEHTGSSGDMNLLLDEAITNALYHAPVLPDGSEKYAEFSVVTLEEREYIEVACGCDTEKYGVSVTDHSGRLSRETVLDRLQRQVSGKGLMDEHGRGMHIGRLFSDRMIININPGVQTEIILMNYFTPKYQGFKPLHINELRGS